MISVSAIWLKLPASSFRPCRAWSENWWVAISSREGDLKTTAARCGSELTTNGNKLVERFIPLAMQHEDVSLRGFKAADVARLKADLVAVYRNLNAVEEELDRKVSTSRKRVKLRRRPRGAPRSDAR